ncbi:MAG: hypothetical protein DSY80_06145, partial [Desulfocapsa sp.]
MSTEHNQSANELQPILKDLQQKIEMFSHLELSQRHDVLLKSFADIIHMNYSLQRFFQVCVSIPVALGGLHGCFY